MIELDKTLVKEIFYTFDHIEIGYDHSVENDYERSVYQNTLSESLSKSEHEIYIGILKRIFDNDYYYFDHDNEEFGEMLDSLECVLKCYQKEGVDDFDWGLDSLSILSLL